MVYRDNNTWVDFNKYMITRLHYSNTTRDERQRKLRHLIKNNVNIDDPESCYDYFARRIDDGCNTSAINHYIKALNAYYKYKNINHVFAQYKENHKPVKIPTVDEIRSVFKSFGRGWRSKTIKTMTYLLANTGMRISELCNLHLDDVDWHRNSITVTGKGNKVRVIPVKPYVLVSSKHPSLNNYLHGYRKPVDDKYVFTWVNTNVTPHIFRKEFKRYVRKAEVGWLHPHSLRHYYATMLLRNHVNVKIVQKLLGHSDIKTTDVYLHVIDDDIYKTVNHVKFDDILFSLTDFYGEKVYGLGEICNFFSLDSCQGGMFFV